MLMQDAAEKLQHLERDANAANQEVVQLADELEKRDDRVEQLQEELEGLRQLTRQHEERLAGRYRIHLWHPVHCEKIIGLYMTFWGDMLFAYLISMIPGKEGCELWGMCRDAELKQLQVQLENTGLDTGRIADLEAELAAAMSQVAAKVCTNLSSLSAVQLLMHSSTCSYCWPSGVQTS